MKERKQWSDLKDKPWRPSVLHGDKERGGTRTVASWTLQWRSGLRTARIRLGLQEEGWGCTSLALALAVALRRAGLELTLPLSLDRVCSVRSLVQVCISNLCSLSAQGLPAKRPTCFILACSRLLDVIPYNLTHHLHSTVQSSTLSSHPQKLARCQRWPARFPIS